MSSKERTYRVVMLSTDGCWIRTKQASLTAEILAQMLLSRLIGKVDPGMVGFYVGVEGPV